MLVNINAVDSAFSCLGWYHSCTQVLRSSLFTCHFLFVCVFLCQCLWVCFCVGVWECQSLSLSLSEALCVCLCSYPSLCTVSGFWDTTGKSTCDGISEAAFMFHHLYHINQVTNSFHSMSITFCYTSNTYYHSNAIRFCNANLACSYWKAH